MKPELNLRFERSQMLFSDYPAQITSLKNIRGSITLKPSRIFIFSSQGKTQSVSENGISPPCTVQAVQYCRAVLRSYSVSIYPFTRDNFLSENVTFESKRCIQNGQYFERRLDLTQCECDVRRVERLVPPFLPNENAEDC